MSTAAPGTPTATKPPRTIGVQTRIYLLILVTASAFAGLLLATQTNWNKQVNLLLLAHVQDTERVVRRILALHASGAGIHVEDYTRWDEFVAFTRQPDRHWADINLTQTISTFDLDVAWVFDDRFNLLFTANPNKHPVLETVPVPLPALASALRARPIRHTYVRTREGMLEMWTSPIQPSDDLDRMTPASGYYLIGRLWTKARMDGLGKDADGTASLVRWRGKAATASVSARTGRIEIVLPLRDIDGKPVGAIEFSKTHPVAAQVHEWLRWSLFLMLASTFAMLVSVGWALGHWVGRPLATITGALHREDPTLLQGSARRHDELGHLARLVGDFFVQRTKLIAAREAAEVATRVKSQFLANISHELRSPMHGILSYSRFGLREAMTADREELLEDFRNIEECGASLLALLNDLLDLSKAEAGRMKFAFSMVSLEEVAFEAVDEFTPLYRDHELTLEICAKSGMQPVRADGMKILQVLRNLLMNAAKFSRPGGKVIIRIEDSGDAAHVQIEDSGVGIPESELEDVFGKFMQSSSTDPRVGGTGLGLAICREIVEGHEGRIWAENRPTGGAQFIFELPFQGPAVVPEPPSEEETGQPGDRGSSPSQAMAASPPGEAQRIAA